MLWIQLIELTFELRSDSKPHGAVGFYSPGGGYFEPLVSSSTLCYSFVV